MESDNLMRGILWGAAIAICGASLVFSLQMNYGDLYDISPNVLSVMIEAVAIAFFTCFWWFLTVLDSEKFQPVHFSTLKWAFVTRNSLLLEGNMWTKADRRDKMGKKPEHIPIPHTN